MLKWSTLKTKWKLFFFVFAGNHTCFKCKKADTNTRKCGVVQCGKFYHEDCVKSLQYAKCENKNFTCPLHACESCCAEQTKKDKSSKGLNTFSYNNFIWMCEAIKLYITSKNAIHLQPFFPPKYQ